MKTIFTLLLAAIVSGSYAQQVGGRVFDERREPAISAVVLVYQGGILKGGALTDVDGNYVIKPLVPGTFDVLIAKSGYDSIFITPVVVVANNQSFVNLALSRSSTPGWIRLEYAAPDSVPKRSATILRKTELDIMPISNVSDLDYRNCHPRKPCSDVNLGGARTQAPVYIIEQCGSHLKPMPIVTVQPAIVTAPGRYTLNRERVNQLPSGRINDYISLFPGIYQSRRGDELNVYGGRSSDNLYILDGVILGL